MNTINRKATITLISGILAILIPLLGFFIGIIGMLFASYSSTEIKKYKEKGKLFVLTGRILCIVGVLLQFLAIVGYIGMRYFHLEY